MGQLNYAELLIMVTALEGLARMETRCDLDGGLTATTLHKVRAELGRRDRTYRREAIMLATALALESTEVAA